MFKYKNNLIIADAGKYLNYMLLLVRVFLTHHLTMTTQSRSLYVFIKCSHVINAQRLHGAAQLARLPVTYCVAKVVERSNIVKVL